jgi:hypothetical protein
MSVERDAEIIYQIAEALQRHAGKFGHDAPAILCVSRARAVYSEVVAPLLAEAERRVAEKALRDAADDINGTGEPPLPWHTEHAVMGWLNARADKIAKVDS